MTNPLERFFEAQIQKLRELADSCEAEGKSKAAATLRTMIEENRVAASDCSTRNCAICGRPIGLGDEDRESDLCIRCYDQDEEERFVAVDPPVNPSAKLYAILVDDGKSPYLYQIGISSLGAAMDAATRCRERRETNGLPEADTVTVVEEVSRELERKGVPDGAGLVEVYEGVSNLWITVLLPVLSLPSDEVDY